MNDDATQCLSAISPIARAGNSRHDQRVSNRPVAIQAPETVADRVVSTLLLPDSKMTSYATAPLPMIDLAPMAQEGSLVYAMGRTDSSGTVAAAQVLNVLGWHSGDQIDISTVHSVVVIRRSMRGRHVLPKKRVIVVPAAIRHACGIEAGASLLLAAAPDHQVLLLHAESVLDEMMTRHYATITLDESA